MVLSEIVRWAPGASALFILGAITFNARRLRRKLGRSVVVVFRTGNLREKMTIAIGLCFCVFLILGGILPGIREPLQLVAAPLGLQLAGIGLMIIGLLVFVLSFRALGDNYRIGVDPDLPPTLVTTGIYGYVRHPIYLGLLSWFTGLAISTFNLLFVIACVLGYVATFAQAIREERFLSDLFKEDYADYMRRTGRFLPRRARSFPQ